MKKVKFTIKNFQLFTEDKIFEFSEVPNIGELINVKSHITVDLQDVFEYELSKTSYLEYGRVTEKIWEIDEEHSIPYLILEMISK